MKQVDRRLQAVQDGLEAKSLSALPDIYLQYVGHEDLRPYGATEFEQARYTAIIDRMIAHADALVARHGPGIVRTHHKAHRRNDIYKVLTNDDLEFMDSLIVTYRLGGRTEEAA